MSGFSDGTDKNETSAVIRLTERPSPDLHQRSNQFCCERAVKHRVAALKPQTRVARSILNVTTIKRSRKSSVLVRDLHVADSIILFTEWILPPGPNLHYPQCNLTSGSLARD